MIVYAFVILCIHLVGSDKSCYWNAECPYKLYSSKTPYDAVRGDIRDYPNPPNCQAVSVWTINRHGNRNPGDSQTEDMKVIAALKDEIIESYNAGSSQLCAQDIENFQSWTWNETLGVSQAFLTGIGYEEIFDIAKRLRERYPHLLNAPEDKFYFRATNEQRTIASSMAFVHGLTRNTDLNLTVDGPWEIDDVIRPYENCAKYQQEVKGGDAVENHINAYLKTVDYQSVQNRVQEKLGIKTQLSEEDIYTFYEICRFYRSWSSTLQSPWCAVFTDEDLVILEYRDDIRHYYRNGYGSWVNARLGGMALQNLYDNFEAVINGTSGRNIVSYFTHDTMMEMVFCALGLFKDNFVLDGTIRNPDRLWRTSFTASFASNLIAVLNMCQETSTQNYRVQIFVNEKETEVCPIDGCTWAQFQDKFASFKDANMDFCRPDYREPDIPESLSGGAHVFKAGSFVLLTQMLLTGPWR